MLQALVQPGGPSAAVDAVVDVPVADEATVACRRDRGVGLHACCFFRGTRCTLEVESPFFRMNSAGGFRSSPVDKEVFDPIPMASADFRVVSFR